MKAKEKGIAVKLRKKGKTYREILKKVQVAKSTLSVWLRDVELPEDYFEKIEDIQEKTREKNAQIIRDKWRKKYEKIYNEYSPLYNNPFYMLGLGIYMGEGDKYSRSGVGLSNSDIKILLMFKRWIEKFFAERPFKWYGCVNVHDKTNGIPAKRWWSENLKLSIEQISKPVVGISRASKRKKRTLKNGTFRLRAGGKDSWKIAIKIRKAMDNAPVV